MLRTPSGMQSLYIYDGTGNPTALVTNGSYTATAYEYDPYGVPTLTEDSGGWGTPMNPYQFKGGLHDRTTNWVKFGHRWYSVAWGRFSQMDTLDSPLDPANANRYAFAANDPINNADPLGLATLNADLGVCIIFCATISPGVDTDGDRGLNFAFGIGPKIGPNIGVSTGSGDYEKGERDFGGQIAGSAGPFRVAGGGGTSGLQGSAGLGAPAFGIAPEFTVSGGL